MHHEILKEKNGKHINKIGKYRNFYIFSNDT